MSDRTQTLSAERAAAVEILARRMYGAHAGHRPWEEIREDTRDSWREEARETLVAIGLGDGLESAISRPPGRAFGPTQSTEVPEEAVELAAKAAWEGAQSEGELPPLGAPWEQLQYKLDGPRRKAEYRRRARRDLQAAAPVLRKQGADQERQRLKEALEQPIHDLATHIGRGRVLADNTEPMLARRELDCAAEAMTHLRAALEADRG